jgi:hypothetical protein
MATGITAQPFSLLVFFATLSSNNSRTKLTNTHMAKRNSGLKKQVSHNHKTKKRLEVKKLMLEAKKKRR